MAYDDFVVWALENAVRHKSKAQAGAIIGRLLHENSENRNKIKEFMPDITKALDQVNSMAYDDQVAMLKEKNPSFFEEKERNIFAFLNIKEGEKVVTAFPPGPEKYPHIGHSKALYLNYDLAKKYNGQFHLRFEDTNPELVKDEFYHVMLENFAWLGVKWDKLIYASDYVPYLMECAKKLIDRGLAYVDRSTGEEISKARETGKPTQYRDLSITEQQKLWEEFLTSEPGKMVVLLKIDLQHKNSTMRDPAIFRILTTPHARQGTKYRCWPMYDFQNAILDGYFGVTHRLRSIEFEMRAELHHYIRNILGLHDTTTYEFGRFNMVGVESSGRVIREKIAKGEVTGWDDPSLTTLMALRRRGFQPEAIKAFVLSTGITKNTATLTWDDLYRQNTKIMDDKAKRFFFVKEPVRIHVGGAPKRTLHLRMHPKQDLGTRTMHVDQEYYLDKDDLHKTEIDTPIRLMENCTIEKNKDGAFKFIGEDVSTFKGKGKQIIHFVPAHEATPVRVTMPDKTQWNGFAESGVTQLSVGACIQFERFGNVRLDRRVNVETAESCIEILEFIFTN